MLQLIRVFFVLLGDICTLPRLRMCTECQLRGLEPVELMPGVRAGTSLGSSPGIVLWAHAMVHI